ncbi:MAG: hypothetical protein ACMUEL_04935 [Flavobacteriales bacterium Tduv]
MNKIQWIVECNFGNKKRWAGSDKALKRISSFTCPASYGGYEA